MRGESGAYTYVDPTFMFWRLPLNDLNMLEQELTV